MSNWFNTNTNRCFPFLVDTVGIPIDGPITLQNLSNAVIVDCGFVLGVQSRFDHTQHTVRLASITRSGDTFYFAFECDAPALYSTQIVFTRSLDDDRYKLQFSDSGELGFSESESQSSSLSPCNEPLWSGYLVTADLADLNTLLAGDGTVEGDSTIAIVEPGLLTSNSEKFVTSINIANQDRTRIEAAEDCDAIVFPYVTGGIIVYERCLQGEITLEAGFNATVIQNAADRSVTIGASVGAGLGQPCGDFPLFSGETRPDGSIFYEGGPACNEVLRSINGAGGSLFQIQTRNGVQITTDPDNNRIVVDIDMQGLSICYDSISHISENV